MFWVGDNARYCIAASNATALTAECAVEETQKRTFTSTLDGLRKIARNEGPLSLWRGLSPTLMMAVPGNVIYFTGYDWLRSNDASPIKRIATDTWNPLLSGAVARVAAAFVVSPIEMFRVRLQATHGSAAGVFQSTLRGLRQMTHTQGYGSLWRGLTLTMWRDVPFSGTYWWGYEVTRNALTDVRDLAQGKILDPDRSMTRRRPEAQDNQPNIFMDSLIAGALSGAVSALITTPFDVGKTRQQVFKHSGDEAAASASKAALKAGEKLPEELSMPRFLAHIFRVEGMKGLFKGWAARCLKVSPACAIMISSYEVGKQYARSLNEKSREIETL